MTVSYERVAVLLGGSSAEREVSLNSGRAVTNALRAAGVSAFEFDTGLRKLEELKEEGVDAVVIMLHGRGGEDGSLQGALQAMQIPYTGSGVLGSALAMDKIKSKHLFKALDLPTAHYRMIRQTEFNVEELPALLADLGGKVMVKPALEGSSIGMAMASDVTSLLKAINNAFEYDEHLLIEQFIAGDEYTVALLDGEILPSINMKTPRDFYDYQAKYQAQNTEYNCPSGLSSEDEAEVGKIAQNAFDALGATGWGRVDFIRDQSGDFLLLEVNTVPGMTERSLVPMAAKQAGYSYQALALKILSTCQDSR